MIVIYIALGFVVLSIIILTVVSNNVKIEKIKQYGCEFLVINVFEFLFVISRKATLYRGSRPEVYSCQDVLKNKYPWQKSKREIINENS